MRSDQTHRRGAVEPSSMGSTLMCQDGPNSGSMGSWAHSSIQSLSSALGRGDEAILSGAAGPVDVTHRCRPNGRIDGLSRNESPCFKELRGVIRSGASQSSPSPRWRARWSWTVPRASPATSPRPAEPKPHYRGGAAESTHDALAGSTVVIQDARVRRRPAVGGVYNPSKVTVAPTRHVEVLCGRSCSTTSPRLPTPSSRAPVCGGQCLSRRVRTWHRRRRG